jgi:hypothetical protein
MKFINIPIFLISLTIGLFYTYLTAPRPNVIYVYPTPENIGQIQYKDESGTCFGFDAVEVSCPADKSKIRSFPMQTKNED